MEKNVSKAVVKRNAVKELNSILKSPFAVMNLINKNRESENIKPLMDLYKIEKNRTFYAIACNYRRSACIL